MLIVSKRCVIVSSVLLLRNLVVMILQKYTKLAPHLSTQWAFTCSKLTIETLEQGVKYVQS